MVLFCFFPLKFKKYSQITSPGNFKLEAPKLQSIVTVNFCTVNILYLHDQ